MVIPENGFSNKLYVLQILLSQHVLNKFCFSIWKLLGVNSLFMLAICFFFLDINRNSFIVNILFKWFFFQKWKKNSASCWSWELGIAIKINGKKERIFQYIKIYIIRCTCIHNDCILKKNLWNFFSELNFLFEDLPIFLWNETE